MKSFKELIQTDEYWITNIQNDLYGIISKYMEEKGLNQSQLAKELGFSKGYISQILNGEFNHKLDKLVKLALAVGKVPKLKFKDFDEYLLQTEAEKERKQKCIHLNMNAGEQYWQKKSDLDDAIAPDARHDNKKFHKEIRYNLTG